MGKSTDAYDNAERLTAITHATAAGATIASYGYTLDAANRLTSQANSWNGGSSTDTIAYGYTNNNQLTAVTHSNTAQANESFSYDANGNRNASGQTTITGNEVQSDGTYNYTYDADGNLVKKTTIATGTATTYTRDDRNRLTEVDSVSGSTTTVVARFTYDALNRQIAEVDNPNGSAATRWTVYDGMTPLLDYNGSGTLQARYLSVPGAIDELLARQTTSGVAWYLDDREGSVKDLVSNSGAVLDHVDYTAYGQVAAESAPSQGDRFKYAGMELDAAINLYYDRARYYDPAAGRFIGQDPTGFAAGDDNLYRYTSNEPTDATDPSGLQQGGRINIGPPQQGIGDTTPPSPQIGPGPVGGTTGGGGGDKPGGGEGGGGGNEGGGKPGDGGGRGPFPPGKGGNGPNVPPVGRGPSNNLPGGGFDPKNPKPGISVCPVTPGRKPKPGGPWKTFPEMLPPNQTVGYSWYRRPSDGKWFLISYFPNGANPSAACRMEGEPLGGGFRTGMPDPPPGFNPPGVGEF